MKQSFPIGERINLVLASSLNASTKFAQYVQTLAHVELNVESITTSEAILCGRTQSVQSLYHCLNAGGSFDTVRRALD